MKNTKDILFRYLPIRISHAVCLLPQSVFESITEIRLRKNAPVSATANGKNLTFDENGLICRIQSAMRATENEIGECIMRLTEGSRYTCDEFISQGFIPLAEGGRAGVCGRGGKNGFAEITSVAIRLYRLLPYTARPLIDRFASDGIRGTLVCSPPAMGKTTFLKSAAYMLASGTVLAPKRVGIADERCELSASLLHCGLCDIISGVRKAEAITMLTRTMSPEVIICDEISASEAESVIEAQGTGVCLIASAHCRDITSLLKRGRMKELVYSGIFPLCVRLGEGYRAEIFETEELL